MGNIKFSNPSELEERRLDIKIRERLVAEKLRQEREVEREKRARYESVQQELLSVEAVCRRRDRLKNKPTLAELNEQRVRLQKELRQKEMQTEKLKLIRREINEEIRENIGKLEDEVSRKDRDILELKHGLSVLQDEYQKLNLKQISYDKIRQRLVEFAIKEKED